MTFFKNIFYKIPPDDWFWLQPSPTVITCLDIVLYQERIWKGNWVFQKMLLITSSFSKLINLLNTRWIYMNKQ